MLGYKIRHVLLLLALFCIKTSYAQTADTVYTLVLVKDAFTRETLAKAKLTVMDADSIVLSIPKVFYNQGKEQHEFFCILPWRQRFILKAECAGYDTNYGELTFKKGEMQKFADDILLHQSAIQLDEVTVVGSKVLMVNRGDTIVYNASALRLSNGSMLDALIRRLPGVELHPGGRITVNGKYVESLLVNGRNFFKGDPKVALENLPAYYVDKIKIYHKTSLWRQVMYGDSVKASKLEDPYVMDVLLKRDYAEGWLANAEACYGTDDRWQARLFGMRYTRRTGLFIYGNANNVNNSQTADRKGIWNGGVTNEGIARKRSGGISFMGDSKDTQMEYGSSIKMSITDTDNDEISSTDNFYSSGNMFQRTRSQQNNRNTEIEWDGKLTMGKSNSFALLFFPHVSYTKAKDQSLMRTASLNSDPQDSYRGETIDCLYVPQYSSLLADILISQRAMHTLSSWNSLAGNVSLTGMFRIGNRWMTLNLIGFFHHEDNDKHYQDHIRQRQIDQETLFSNRYTNFPIKKYDYDLQINYSLYKRMVRMKERELRLVYTFHQGYKSSKRNLFHHDSYGDYEETSSFNKLPSMTDSMLLTFDTYNSYRSNILCRKNNVMLEYVYDGWMISLPVTHDNNRIDDNRNELHRHITHQELSLSPSASYRHQCGFSISCSLTPTLPEISLLLDVRDDADPLSVVLGNPDLVRTDDYSLSMAFRPQLTGQKTFNFSVDGRVSRNAIAMSRSYDLKTGVTTFRPENINGNWSTWGSISYGRPVGKGKRLRITSTTDYRYHHSVDFSSIGTQPTTMKNTVHNLTVGEALKGEYRLHDWYVAATTHASWRRATSPSENFLPISAWDYNYGVTLTKPLLKNLDLNTELMMWSRRGYTDRSMNDDCLIWNATVSYAFGRLKEWIVKINGVDMLGQRSSVRHIMNAQGHTETWYRTIPSYWMVHLMYQFKKPPKKRT